MKYDTPEAALAALRAPSDVTAGAYVHNCSTVVVRVVERSKMADQVPRNYPL